MSNDIIKYGSISGEISTTLFGRSDLEQYDLAWAKAENWFVNYQGGLSTRPGMEFCDWVKDDDQPTKFFEFQFAPDTSNVYVVLFGHNYVRFIQDGGYILEAEKTITDVTVSAGVVTITSNAHGYLDGDWVKLHSIPGFPELTNRSFVVAGKTTNTFQIKTYPALANPPTVATAAAAGFSARVYTLVSPYSGADLELLSGKQRRDLIRLTSINHPIRNLRRIGDANWTLDLEPVGNVLVGPSNVTVTASDTGNAGALFAVTSVDADGQESVMTRPFILQNAVNWTTTAGSIKIKWDKQNNKVYYNVYRSMVFQDSDDLSIGLELGFIAKVHGTTFTDNNVIPDFTKTPPVRYNPFAPGAVKNVYIDNVGSGYDRQDSMGITGGAGSGFSGYPIVVDGNITGVLIRLNGEGYSAPVVTFSGGGGGTGATATAELTPLTGTYPAISGVFQQRQLYAATANDPLTIWGSRPGMLSNFDYSSVVLDNDSYEHELDSEQITPIRHMVSMRGGLILMSQSGIWQLTGTGNSGVVTAKNAIAEPQNYTGVSEVEPIRVNTDLLYVEGKGYTVRLLSYNDYARVYNGEDRSLISNHLFGVDKQIVRWSFAENPFKVVWAARSDGQFLSFTIVKDEKIFGWTPHSTRGKVLDVANALEAGLDRTYMMTSRLINGRTTKFIERLHSRNFVNVEDAFCVDCGLTLGHNYVNQVLAISDHDPVAKTCTLTVGSPLWSGADVNKIIRAGGAKLRVSSFVTDTEITCQILRPFTDTILQDPLNRVYSQAANTWTMDTPVNQISGLWHLEGETLNVLADGSVVENVPVVGGQIALVTPATRIFAGIPYTCTAQTLPPVVSNAIIESRRKRVVEIGLRLDKSRGLRNGERLDKLYEMKERTTEVLGEPTVLQSGMKLQLIEPRWDENSQTYFVQKYPLPATILALVRDIEVGDDKD